jgi:formylmethanofuran dehydrogenase subunit E
MRSPKAIEQFFAEAAQVIIDRRFPDHEKCEGCGEWMLREKMHVWADGVYTCSKCSEEAPDA